jgi:predicted chitinase
VILNAYSGITVGEINANAVSGGEVKLQANQDISTKFIYASSRSGSGNKISITSVNGAIDTNGGALSSTSFAGGNAGAIILIAAKDIKVGDIFARSRDGEVSTTGVWTGGKVTLDAGGNIKTGSITTTSITGNAGIVKIEAGGDILTGAIASNTFAGSGKGGNITFDGKNITAKSLRADSVGADGGQIRLTADKFIQITGSTSVNGKDYSIFTDSKDVAPSPNDTGARSAKIVITHSRKVLDGTVTPFVIGDSSKNGTASSISDGIFDLLVSAGFNRSVYGDNFKFNDIRITRPLGIIADISDIFGLPSGTLSGGSSTSINEITKALTDSLPFFLSTNKQDTARLIQNVFSTVSRIPEERLLNLEFKLNPTAFTPDDKRDLRKSLHKYYLDLVINMAITGINTPENQNHFLAQVMKESSYFRKVIEDGGQGKSYAPFYGRGLIQITDTDRLNPQTYREFGEFLNLGDTFVKDPNLVVSDPRFTVLSAIWYWTSVFKQSNILSATGNRFSSFQQIADATSISSDQKVSYITDVINFGTDSLPERTRIYNGLAGLTG